MIKRGAGRLVLAGGNSFTGGTVVEGGELVIRDPAALGSGGLEVRAGARVRIDLGTGRLDIPQLGLSAAGVLDLGTGSIRLASGSYDLAAIRGLITSARADGAWTGPGITSSSAAAEPARAVGSRLLADGSLLVGYAAAGDATMDGSVNVQDLIAISTSGKYGSVAGDAGWWEGDFNDDGLVNINDLVSLSTSGLYGAGSYLPTASAPMTAAAAALEPAVAQEAPDAATPDASRSLDTLVWMAYAEPFDTTPSKKSKS